MTDKDIVSELRSLAQASPAANAVFHVFAVRERSRKVLTLFNMNRRMQQEKYRFTKEEYAEVLVLLSKLSLGTLVTDVKGNVKALKDIKLSLQSVGRAALSAASDLKVSRSSNKYGKLNVALQQIERFSPPLPAAPTGLIVGKLSIHTEINGKSLDLRLDDAMDAKEIANIISLLKKGVA